jgi:ribosomal protein S18 acetylase RimI-like enzyme
MDRDLVLARFDALLRRDARPDAAGTVVERSGGVVRQVGRPGDWNGVLWSDLDEAGADAAIAETVDRYAALGLEFEWKWYSHDRPADLPDRLRAAGFLPQEPETLMVAEVSELPSTVDIPDSVELRPVTDEAGVDAAVAVHERAFGTPGGTLRHRMLGQLAGSPDTVVAVLATAAGTPVSAARMELHEGTGFASLWGGGTVPGWRGRGIYRALVAYRARIAAERGYEYLQVDASADSRPILARLGFAGLSVTVPFIRTGTGAPA